LLDVVDKTAAVKIRKHNSQAVTQNFGIFSEVLVLVGHRVHRIRLVDCKAVCPITCSPSDALQIEMISKQCLVTLPGGAAALETSAATQAGRYQNFLGW